MHLCESGTMYISKTDLKSGHACNAKNLLQFKGNDLFLDSYKGEETSVLGKYILLAREETSISNTLASFF